MTNSWNAQLKSKMDMNTHTTFHIPTWQLPLIQYVIVFNSNVC